MAEFGVDVFVYCDEGLQSAVAEEWSYVAHHMVLVLTTFLGLIRSVPKDRPIPARLIPFLGWMLASDVLRISATRLRFVEFRRAAIDMWRAAATRTKVTVRAKARLFGIVSAMADGMRRVRLRVVALQRDLAVSLKEAGGDYDGLVAVPTFLIPVLRRLAASTWHDNWNYIRLPVPTVFATADASDYRWHGNLQVIPGDTMVRERMADAGSRRRTMSWHDYQLDPALVRDLFRRCRFAGAKTVDLFCEVATMQTDRGVTRSYSGDARMLWCDAFSRPWDPHRNPDLRATDQHFLFPPANRIREVLDRIPGCPLRMLLILPVAPRYLKRCLPWLTGRPVILPPLRRIMRPPEGRRAAADVEFPPWTLMALELSTRPARPEAWKDRPCRPGDGDWPVRIKGQWLSSTDTRRGARATANLQTCWIQSRSPTL